MLSFVFYPEYNLRMSLFHSFGWYIYLFSAKCFIITYLLIVSKLILWIKQKQTQ